MPTRWRWNLKSWPVNQLSLPTRIQSTTRTQPPLGKTWGRISTLCRRKAGRTFTARREADVLELGTIEKPTQYRFRVYAVGRDLMRDLVASEVVERYLVQTWEVG